VDWPAFDVVAQAMGGIMSVTGPDEAHPTKVGPGIGDTVPALFLSFGIVAAVLHAREKGEGQFVDVSMVDAVLSISERLVFQHSFAKITPAPDGNHHPYWAPFGTFPAKDGHVALACTSDDFFRELCTALDAPELLEDPRFRSLGRRRHTRVEVIDAIEQLTKRFTKAELYKRLGGRVPFGPVYRMNEIASDPHFATREMLVPIELPGIPEPVEIAGIPVKLSATPGRIERRGPNLGEHTDEVLSDAGFSPTQIEQLRRAAVVK
jgi:crotonobetainyl-CoA:carnitine CoA-transferase CaiB-like acyl-CoA transferase